MDGYDQRAWEQIRDWQQRGGRVSPKRLIPSGVRDRASQYASRGREAARSVPGYSAVSEALSQALEGIGSTIAGVAAASIPRRLVIARYRRHGHAIERLEDILALPLQTADRVFPRRKRYAYAGASFTAGGAAGAATMVSSSATVAGGVAGAGAGAVPGALATAAVLAADAAATLTAGSRLVAETGAFYGYDPTDPSEQLFIAGVMGLATTSSEAGKQAALIELRSLSKELARNAPWVQLNQHNAIRIVDKLYSALGERMTKKQLGKAVPALGIVIGAGINAAVMGRFADSAYFAYRERRLRERYGDLNAEAAPAQGPQPPIDSTAEEDDGALGIVQELEAAFEEQPGDAAAEERQP